MSVTLGTGALITLERRDDRVVALLQRTVERHQRLLVPAGVVAQAWRNQQQVRIARLLRSPDVEVVPLDAAAARAVGVLLGRSRTTDTVDAHVVVVARTTGSSVASSDPDDLHHLAPALHAHAV